MAKRCPIWSATLPAMPGAPWIQRHSTKRSCGAGSPDSAARLPPCARTHCASRAACQHGRYTYLDSFRKPVKTSACKSILKDKESQAQYPQCIKHMAYIKEHPSDSPCFGGLGHNSMVKALALVRRLRWPLPLARGKLADFDAFGHPDARSAKASSST